MPQFNIHWKGYPRRHLPRIRVTSPHYGTVRGPRYAHFAALKACQLPYSLDLQRARQQQDVRIRRKKQNIRGSLRRIMASSRSSQQIMSDIRLSRLESPREDLASKERVNRELEVLIFTDQLTESPFYLSSDLVASSKTVSNPSLMSDGRDCSLRSIYTANQTEAVDLKNSVKNKRQRSKAREPVRREHDQVMPAGSVRKTSIYSRSPVLGKSRTYDPRLPVMSARRRAKSTSSKRNAIYQPKSIIIKSKPAATDDEQISTDLPTQQANRSSASSISTGASPQPGKRSDLPSRTPTQLLALKKFSRGLERHLIAQEAVRKACLSPSLSSSTFSAGTVVEFVPYIGEFQAAGLAVSSTEQRRPVIQQSRREVVPLPLKEAGDKAGVLANKTEGTNNESPIVSHDGFGGGLYTDTMSSRTTVIAFSNCREPNSIVAYPARNISIKKALLPWLRKAQEPSSLSKSFPPKRPITDNNMRSSSESTCETCTTTILDFSPWPVGSERKQIKLNSSPIVLRPIDVRGFNTDDDSIKGENKEVLRPIVPERPVCVLPGPQNYGTNYGKISGNKTFPLDVSPKVDQGTRTILTNSGANKNEKAKMGAGPASQTNGRVCPIEPIPASGVSIGSFRTSPKLLAQQRSPRIKDPRPVNILKDATIPTQGATAHLLSKPPSHYPPLPPGENHLSASNHTRQSPDLSIQDQYGFETPSIFELALHDVVNRSQSLQEQFVKEEKIVRDLLTSSSGYDDPVKRNSALYKAPKLSSNVSSMVTASSLGFAIASETQTKTSTGYSHIRDNDVFKGLQIALAAACNKDLDLWIMKVAGCRVRRFLADLRAFEGLGVNALTVQAKQTAKKRTEEHNQRMRDHKCGEVQGHEMENVQEKPNDTNEKRRPIRAGDSGRRGLLVAQMLGRRESRAGETVREGSGNGLER